MVPQEHIENTSVAFLSIILSRWAVLIHSLIKSGLESLFQFRKDSVLPKMVTISFLDIILI